MTLEIVPLSCGFYILYVCVMGVYMPVGLQSLEWVFYDGDIDWLVAGVAGVVGCCC